MSVSTLRERVRAAVARLSAHVVTACPPELVASESCRQLQCDDNEWVGCKHRVKVARLSVAADEEMRRKNVAH